MRRFHLLVISIFLSTAAAAADAVVSGNVVDETGRPLPRALIRALDSSGAQTATTFADEAGRFALVVPDTGVCRLEVSLTGFEPQAVRCTASTPLRIALPVQPIRETVIVTATRTETPGSQVGASVTVFTADDLESRRTPLVADLLRTSAGAVLVRAGGIGNITSLFVRGGESNYNKVLLDGIPLNEPGGVFNFSNITTAGLERVEIVRGAQSALFGSDAMASVVQLFTRRGDRSLQRPHVSFAVEGGSYGTVRGDAAVSRATGRFDYTVGAGGLVTDNRVANNAFDNTTVFTNAGIALGRAATVRVIGRGELERVGVPGATAFGRPDLDAFFKRREGIGGISLDQQLRPAIRHRASYSLASSYQQSTNLTLDPPFTAAFEGRVGSFQSSDFATDSRTNLRRHHASYQIDWRLSPAAAAGNHLLTLLADWDGERVMLDNRLSSARATASRNNFGWSAQHQALWRGVFITVGGRLEHNDSFGTAAVPRGSVVWIVRPTGGAFGETKFKTSAGLGIKEPTVLQSFSISPFFLGNPDLAPERSRGVDVGVEQRLASDRAKIDLIWFDNRFRDIISLRTNPATFEAQYFNIGLTRARGVELGFEAAPVATVRIRAGYTFLDSEILESTAPANVVFRQGASLFRRPRHSGYAGLTLGWNRVAADLNGVFIGPFVDSDFASLQPPMIENPGHNTWDARASFSISPKLTLIGTVDNLTDADYMEPLGYPALGRAGRIGLKVAF